MGSKKQIKLHNKSDRPDNIVLKEQEIKRECQRLEEKLPSFLESFFVYLKGNVLPLTRLAYLHDVTFFYEYLVDYTDLTQAREIGKVTLEEMKKIKGSHINLFIDFCRQYEKETDRAIYVYENNNKTLARKKSSLSVMFKQLYREELLEKNITDSFNPIRVPKVEEREIKALQDDEVMVMLDAVTTGQGLTKKEHSFWEKTKHRDKAILVLFLTYGLRISELEQLNVDSFQFSRGEFTVYRKRGKQSTMPLNRSVSLVLNTYIYEERPLVNEKNQEGEAALFLSLQGRRMTQRQIRELVKKYTSIALKTSRSKGYSPHKLRATAATSLIGRGNSIFDVQSLLDHEQVTTTQLYAKHKLNVKRDLVHGMEWEVERKQGEGETVSKKTQEKEDESGTD